MSRCVKWSKDEDVILRVHYCDLSREELCLLLPGRSWAGIVRRANRQGLKRRTERWSPQEDNILFEKYVKGSKLEILTMLPGRGWAGISARARKLGIYRGSKWTEEEVGILVEEFSYMEKTELLLLLPGRSWSSILHKARRLNLKRFCNKWATEEDMVLQCMYGRYSYKDILKKLPGRTKGAMCGRALKLGLKSNISFVMSRVKSIYTYNASFFSTPNILNSYWAGFIAADGNIRKNGRELRIMLSSKDHRHLCRFKKDIEFNGPIKIDKRRCSYISVTSHKIVEDLKINFNIVPAKTLILVPPEGLNDECLFSFILGYIDGDGCIMFRKNNGGVNAYIVIKIIGTRKVLDCFKVFVEMHFDGVRVRKTSSKLYNCGNGITFVYSFSNYRAINFIAASFALKVPRLRRKWSSCVKFLNKDKKYSLDYRYYSF